jgi:hypothetical protein
VTVTLYPLPFCDKIPGSYRQREEEMSDETLNQGLGPLSDGEVELIKRERLHQQAMNVHREVVRKCVEDKESICDLIPPD